MARNDTTTRTRGKTRSRSVTRTVEVHTTPDTAPFAADTPLSSTSCGPKIQPSLNPGANIFEKDPRCSVLSGAREYIVGTGLPEYLSSL